MFFSSKGQAQDKAALSSRANGGSSQRPSAVTAKQESGATATRRRPRDVRQARMSQTFAQVVAVLMRDPNFQNLRLAELEWLVIPPIMAGQFRLGHAVRSIGSSKTETRGGGVSVPIAVALWARVSPEVDKALSENLDKQARLRSDQWASGDNVWLMAVGGERRAVPHFLKQLAEEVFKGQDVKMRLRGSDGGVIVKTLDQAI
jgi:cytolysin-activating lysine-acyltransferase